MRALALCALSLLAACAGGEAVDCRIRCSSGGLCPDDTSCSVEGFCRTFGATGLCQPGDGGVDGGGIGTDCDFLTQSCVNPAHGCYLRANGTLNECLVAGNTSVGGPCNAANNCRAGSQCFDFNSGVLRCLQVCRTDGGSPVCDAGTCRALAGNTTPGSGLCN